LTSESEFVVPAKAGTQTPQQFTSAAAYGSRVSLALARDDRVRGPSKLGAERTEHFDDGYALPYTGTTAPRVTRLSDDARNRIVAVTSSTFGHVA